MLNVLLQSVQQLLGLRLPPTREWQRNLDCIKYERRINAYQIHFEDLMVQPLPPSLKIMTKWSRNCALFVFLKSQLAIVERAKLNGLTAINVITGTI